MALDAASPFGMPWGAVALVVAALALLSTVALVVVRRRDPGRRRTALLLGVAFVAVLVAGSVTVATVRQANDLRAACEEWSSTAAALLEGDAAAGRLPADLTDRQRVWAEKSDKRREQLARVWAASAVRDRAHELEEAMELVLDDAGYEAYSDNRMVVNDCEHGDPTIDGAEVTFTGHMEYLLAAEDEWSQSPLTRYSVRLVPTGDDSWLLGDVDDDQLESP